MDQELERQLVGELSKISAWLQELTKSVKRLAAAVEVQSQSSSAKVPDKKDAGG